MSKSPIHNQLMIQDGAGNHAIPFATGTWVTQWVNIEEHRRVNFTFGIGSATGAPGDVGGFTGSLAIQGTDELAQCNGGSGTQEAGNTSRPGLQGYTGARFAQTVPSGTYAVTNASNVFQMSLTDVGSAFIRVAFNVSATGPTATGTLGGSGTWNVFLTAKGT